MGKKVLIVDDDAGICSSLAILFREEGYDVDQETDSTKVAILVMKNKYDVCLFDYKMKELNGMDLLKIAKDANPQCPVFIMSGMLNIDKLFKEEKRAGLIAGVLSKPFDVEALLKSVAAIVK